MKCVPPECDPGMGHDLAPKTMHSGGASRGTGSHRTQLQLEVSRIVSGKLRLDVKPRDLASVIDAAIDVVRPAADAKNIKLIAEIDAQVSRANYDDVRMHRSSGTSSPTRSSSRPKGDASGFRLSTTTPMCVS